MSNQKVNSKDWIPVGNYVLVKPIALNKNELVPEFLQEKEAWEILGFGTSYEPIEDLAVGDKVLIVEYDGKKEGTKLSIANEGDVYMYPPNSIVAKIVEE
jgi:hypothetical protein